MPRALRILAWTLAIVAVLLGALAFLTRDIAITSWSMIWNAVSGAPGPQAEPATVGQRLLAPPGWRVSLYSNAVPEARFMRLTPAGDLLVSQPRLGQVLLLARDADGDGHPDRQQILLEGLDRPHGLDIADGYLYVGETGAVGRVPFDAASGTLAGSYAHVITGLPPGGNHWSRTVRIGPDGWLYVHVGSSCNACEEEHPWRATLLRARPDGSGLSVHATGLRNSVGFDWAPWSGELYATDNGRDLLGDDFPPCELNRIVAGGLYGWPRANGFNVPDPELGAGHEAEVAAAIPPVHGFRAHNAPLGIAFLRHQPDPSMARSALVALHGSWNRTRADGYRVARLDWAEDGSIRETDFLTGFEKDGNVIGRPVDVVEAPDGTLFVSDDYAGAIYRLTRGEGGDDAEVAVTPTAAAAPTADPLSGLDAATIAAAHVRGEELMARYACTGCHTPGSPIGQKLDTLASRYTVDSLTQYFVMPRAPMPVFPLAPDDRRALAIHLLDRGRQPAPP